MDIDGQDPRRLRSYAHRHPDGTSITYLVINLSHEDSRSIRIPDATQAELFLCNSPDLFGKDLLVNGSPLRLTEPLKGRKLSSQELITGVALPPLSYAFLVVH